MKVFLILDNEIIETREVQDEAELEYLNEMARNATDGEAHWIGKPSMGEKLQQEMREKERK